MLLTEAQHSAVNSNSNSLVVACPGSGKTRTLIAKLLKSVEDVRDTSRKVACITYTNSAVYEIEKRLRMHGKSGDEDFCDISTIHSFCLTQILRFFHWRLPILKKGFVVVTPESAGYKLAKDTVSNNFGFSARQRDSLENVSREPNGMPTPQSEIPDEAILAFWSILESRGEIDFPNIVYYSLLILQQNPSLAKALACKYMWILVDEFQDTSAIQVDIFKLIATSQKSRFFLVGDPYQSIYSFAGAKPELVESFALHIGARTDFTLLENWRSSPLIIDHAERLCPRDPRMVGIGPALTYKDAVSTIETATVFEGIVDYFLPSVDELGIPYGEAAVLAPWWLPLWKLGKKLREYGIPIVGPGSRPYRRTRLFSRIAEQICLYIEAPNPNLIPVIERELFLLLNAITGRVNFQCFSYHGRTTVFRLIRIGTDLKNRTESGVKWLNEASIAFTDCLVREGFMLSRHESVLHESVLEMVDDMARQEFDLENLKTSDLGIFANSLASLNLLTMHGSKGREFEAVALIDLHDGRLPDFRSNDITKIDEDRRRLYVASTRAKRILMFVVDSEDSRNEPSRFLGADGLQLPLSRLGSRS
ncbi:ATP-dependent helicase [bacterium AH-315-J21]|nr:ATP-dependent helicase [bacterium AH-315-J21]